MAYIPLIDYTYFHDLLPIPGIFGVGNVAVESTQTEMTEYIARYEKQMLQEVLGDDLYDAFQAGLGEESVAEKWTDLKAQLIDATAKTSPLANYVWYIWWERHQGFLNDTGEMRTSSANSTPSQDPGKYREVYNAMVRDLGYFYEWLQENTAIYTEWGGTKWDIDYINRFGI